MLQTPCTVADFSKFDAPLHDLVVHEAVPLPGVRIRVRVRVRVSVRVWEFGLRVWVHGSGSGLAEKKNTPVLKHVFFTMVRNALFFMGIITPFVSEPPIPMAGRKNDPVGAHFDSCTQDVPRVWVWGAIQRGARKRQMPRLWYRNLASC